MANKPKKTKNLASCSIKPRLEDRSLISSDQAEQLESLFRILGNRTRLRMLHALIRAGNLSVSELAESVEMKPQAVSNQLQRLVDRGMLASKRDGNNIHYRIVDPCVMDLVDRGLCLLEDTENRKA